MRIHYYAQSTYRIISEDGTRIVIDPYEHTDRIRYDATFDEADIVLVTHDHGDHNNVEAVPGDYDVIRGSGTHSAKGFDFHGIASFHDQERGAERGPNTIFVFDVDGVRVAFLGDQGCELDESQYAELEGTNVMIAPVGGGLTLEPDLIWKMAERLQPEIFIPCHFKTEDIDLPFAPLDEFLAGKPSVNQVGSSAVELKSDDLPEPIQIVVLERSR